MPNTQIAAKTMLAINTDELPAPDAFFTDRDSNKAGNTGVARPVGAVPNVADSGRIIFGACARLPATTALPRPAGSMPSVADSGRIGFGACARYPANR